jgi:hypothetical protein
MKQFLKGLSHDTTVDTIDWPESRMIEQELVSIRILDDQRNLKPALRYFFSAEILSAVLQNNNSKTVQSADSACKHSKQNYNVLSGVMIFCTEVQYYMQPFSCPHREQHTLQCTLLHFQTDYEITIE